MPNLKKKIVFIVVMESPPPEKNFSLKNLPGSSKIDVVSRNILTLFPNTMELLDLTYIAYFSKNDPTFLLINNLNIRDIPYDEIEIASILKEQLQLPLEDYMPEKIQNADISNWYKIDNLESLLNQYINENFEGYFLQETGEHYGKHLEHFSKGNLFLFVLGGRNDISEENEAIIRRKDFIPISLGEKSYLASTCLLKIISEFRKIIEIS